ncbi:RlmE family RNA methyltransferase [Candidatus Thorarchaeota archaeon]|nr:MAG: RlmE family RNA methyltransferase [Candidatus Thorarchaeota archaeon]
MGRRKKPRTKEHYYKSAKSHGYRARSAYKLRQIASKYNLLDGVSKAVELCSSPGGWTQVLLELSHTIQVIAVDLSPMAPLEGSLFIQGNILDPDIHQKIMDTAGGPVDLVLSDCSPKVSGNWDLDVARQLELAQCTLEIGLRLLRGNGKVLAKVFQ